MTRRPAPFDRFHLRQMVFFCTDYTNGTSGGPFLAHVSGATGAGQVIGVIGGYEHGGDTPSVSYSARFGSAIAALFRRRSPAREPGPRLRRRFSLFSGCWSGAGQERGMILSISARSSASGAQSAAAALAWTCSAEVAPAMTEPQPGRAASAAMATSSTDLSRCCPHRASASTWSSFSSVT